MNYLITYRDKIGEIHKKIVNSVCLSLVEVKANLLAYKLEGKVIEVKLYEMDYFILKAINKKNIDILIHELNSYCNGVFTMEQLAPMAKEQSIKYEIAPIGEKSKYDSEMWYIVDDYIVAFSGIYNQYGILELKNITIYDSTDSIIIQKNID